MAREYEKVIKPILQRYWMDKFNTGKNKWNIVDGEPGVEGQCSASILTDSGTIEGKYIAGSYHAEMDALLKSMDKTINKIEISSPPCPKCAVVLEIKGLSDKVYIKKKSSRLGPSGNWNEEKKKELVDIIAPSSIISDEEKNSKNDAIYSYFQGGAWYY